MTDTDLEVLDRLGVQRRRAVVVGEQILSEASLALGCPPSVSACLEDAAVVEEVEGKRGEESAAPRDAHVGAFPGHVRAAWEGRRNGWDLGRRRCDEWYEMARKVTEECETMARGDFLRVREGGGAWMVLEQARLKLVIGELHQLLAKLAALQKSEVVRDHVERAELELAEAQHLLEGVESGGEEMEEVLGEERILKRRGMELWAQIALVRCSLVIPTAVEMSSGGKEDGLLRLALAWEHQGDGKRVNTLRRAVQMVLRGLEAGVGEVAVGEAQRSLAVAAMLFLQSWVVANGRHEEAGGTDSLPCPAARRVHRVPDGAVLGESRGREIGEAGSSSLYFRDSALERIVSALGDLDWAGDGHLTEPALRALGLGVGSSLAAEDGRLGPNMLAWLAGPCSLDQLLIGREVALPMEAMVRALANMAFEAPVLCVLVLWRLRVVTLAPQHLPATVAFGSVLAKVAMAGWRPGGVEEIRREALVTALEALRDARIVPTSLRDASIQIRHHPSGTFEEVFGLPPAIRRPSNTMESSDSVAPPPGVSVETPLASFDLAAEARHKGDGTQRLTDYVLTIGPGLIVGGRSGILATESPAEVAFEPEVLERMPTEDSPGGPLPGNIGMFAFPAGIRLSQSLHVPIAREFALTGISGVHISCCAVCYWDRVHPAFILHALARNDETNPSSGDVLPGWMRDMARHRDPTESLYVERAIVVLSRSQPFRLLRAVAARILQDVIEAPHRALAHQMLVRTALSPLPRPDPLRSLGVRFGDAHIILAPRHPDAPPLFSFPTWPLLLRLSAANVIRVWVATLCERHIVVHSHNASVIVPACETLRGLLYPLQWSTPFIPLTPAELLPYISVPTPLIMGLCLRDASSARAMAPDATFVNLDADTVDPGDTPLPRLSAELERDLLSSLALSEERAAYAEDTHSGGAQQPERWLSLLYGRISTTSNEIGPCLPLNVAPASLSSTLSRDEWASLPPSRETNTNDLIPPHRPHLPTAAVHAYVSASCPTPCFLGGDDPVQSISNAASAAIPPSRSQHSTPTPTINWNTSSFSSSSPTPQQPTSTTSAPTLARQPEHYSRGSEEPITSAPHAATPFEDSLHPLTRVTVPSTSSPDHPPVDVCLDSDGTVTFMDASAHPKKLFIARYINPSREGRIQAMFISVLMRLLSPLATAVTAVDISKLLSQETHTDPHQKVEKSSPSSSTLSIDTSSSSVRVREPIRLLFNPEAFIEASPTRLQPIITEIAGTQMLEHFLRECIPPSRREDPASMASVSRAIMKAQRSETPLPSISLLSDHSTTLSLPAPTSPESTTQPTSSKYPLLSSLAEDISDTPSRVQLLEALTLSLRVPTSTRSLSFVWSSADRIHAAESRTIEVLRTVFPSTVKQHTII